MLNDVRHDPRRNFMALRAAERPLEPRVPVPVNRSPFLATTVTVVAALVAAS
jgi:hypothetical protein